MESINNLLSNRDFSEPEEIAKLKAYIYDVYDSQVEVKISQKGLVIITKSSSLANSIRLNVPQIQRQLKIDQKLYIRIN